MKIYILYVVIVLSSFSTSSALAVTYYVDSSTANTTFSSCTNISTPCTAEAAMVNAVAGDVVNFLAGTYELGQSDNNQSGAGVLYPRNSGTSNSNRITFQANPGDTVILNTTVAGQIISRAIGNRGQSYITFKGFTVSSTGNAYSGSIGVGGGSTGVTIDSCSLLGGYGTNTDNISGIAFGDGSTDSIVKNCTFDGYRDTADNQNTSAIKTYYADYLTVENCEFNDSTVAIFNKQDSSHNTYKNNFIYNSNVSIKIESDNTGNSEYTDIYNNVIVNSTYVAISVEQKNSNYANYVTINNNTIYNSASSSRAISINNADYRYIYNNIVVADASESELRFVNASTIDQVDHNLWHSPSLSFLGNFSTYGSLALWQVSNELTATYDAGCGSTQHPGCGSVAQAPNFSNDSGTLTEIADFAVSNTLGRHGGPLGANVLLVGVGKRTGTSISAAAPVQTISAGGPAVIIQ